MVNLLFGLLGLFTGSAINSVADNLPEKMPMQRPYCLKCGHVHSYSHWLAVGRWLWGGRRCASCGAAIRNRAILVEVSTATIFAILPVLISEPVNLAVNTLFVALLILIIVIDLEHRLILDAITYPSTAAALIASVLVTNDQNTLPLAFVGALVGFLMFFIAFWVGQWMFGPGALGFGDVKLAMLLGAMLGFHRVVFALVLAVLLGGAISVIVLIVNRRVNRKTFLPYGQYLAIAGIFMLIWGTRVVSWYTGS